MSSTYFWHCQCKLLQYCQNKILCLVCPLVVLLLLFGPTLQVPHILCSHLRARLLTRVHISMWAMTCPQRAPPWRGCKSMGRDLQEVASSTSASSRLKANIPLQVQHAEKSSSWEEGNEMVCVISLPNSKCSQNHLFGPKISDAVEGHGACLSREVAQGAGGKQLGHQCQSYTFSC